MYYWLRAQDKKLKVRVKSLRKGGGEGVIEGWGVGGVRWVMGRGRKW